MHVELLPPELEEVEELEEELEELLPFPVVDELPPELLPPTLVVVVVVVVVVLPPLLELLVPPPEQLPEIGTQSAPIGVLFAPRICWQVAPLGQLWPLLQSTPQ